MKPITKGKKIKFIYYIYWMCLLLNYPLAHLHVAMERAVEECGKMINDHFSQSRGGCQENKKKIKNTNKQKNPTTLPFLVAINVGDLKTEKQVHPEKCVWLDIGKSGKGWKLFSDFFITTR